MSQGGFSQAQRERERERITVAGGMNSLCKGLDAGKSLVGLPEDKEGGCHGIVNKGEMVYLWPSSWFIH